jgi:hypothetical protein
MNIDQTERRGGDRDDRTGPGPDRRARKAAGIEGSDVNRFRGRGDEVTGRVQGGDDEIGTSADDHVSGPRSEPDEQALQRDRLDSRQPAQPGVERQQGDNETVPPKGTSNRRQESARPAKDRRLKLRRRFAGRFRRYPS